MNYMDCKALSEIVEAHEQLLRLLQATRIEMKQAGLDTAALRRANAPAIAQIICSYRLARQRYAAACDLYLSSLPASAWSGPAETSPFRQCPPARAA